MHAVSIFSVSTLICLILNASSFTQTISLKDECLTTLRILVDAQHRLQIKDKRDADYGAIRCPSCNILHTRAAEAVYPFAVAFKHSKSKNDLMAAIDLGNWLIRQQGANGAWKETPEEWTGTTTDQLLMMAQTWQIVRVRLSQKEKLAWENSIRKAADYLTEAMNPDFASINYCTTTAASLAMTHRYFPNEKYLLKAKELAHQTLAKMDEDGFICAEGDRVYNAKYGADIGYEIDMSLWGLELYSRLVGDSLVHQVVSASLQNHLPFVYPNGAIDGSWGIRSNKWTTYGSQTADGCQILFSLFADEDARYRTAAWRNLQYLRTMIKDGLIGYGPHYWSLFSNPPCIYPTCMRSKNLAMTVELGDQNQGVIPPLPSESPTWVRHFPAVDVVLVRTGKMMATISAYRYKELQKRFKSKYMHRPTGGSICNLWLEDHGFLQTSSQTEYNRWEPMHFPEMQGLLPLTPRIEFFSDNGYFTNLYEFDGRLSVIQSPDIVIKTSGELCDKNLLPGGVAYQWQHRFTDEAVEKTVFLRYHDGNRLVRIVEPIVRWPNMTFKKVHARKVLITTNQRNIVFEIVEGEARIEMGEKAELYVWPFPSLQAFPITLIVDNPGTKDRIKISYRLGLEE